MGLTNQHSPDPFDSCGMHKDRRPASIYDRYARQIDVLLGSLTENLPHRRRAVAAMKLNRDSVVLDVGCGVGSNFKSIEAYLSEEGVLVGIDVSTKSLELAREHASRHSWSNVHLMNVSVADYRPEIKFDAVLCTFALEIVEDYKHAIDNVFDLLRPGGSFVMIGMKLTSSVPSAWLNPLVEKVWTMAGVDPARDVRSYVESKEWNVEVREECFYGFYYILRATKA